MKLSETIEINATPADVWDVLRVPATMAQWNPKCVRCDSDLLDVRRGTRFKASFRFKNQAKEWECDCSVLECEPRERLKFRFDGGPFKPGKFVEETFTLSSSGPTSTKVRHVADFTSLGLPVWLRFLIKFVSLVGRKSGKSQIDGLRELVCGQRDSAP